MAISLQFPSERMIGSYLKEHPLTKELDSRIIELAASQFANQRKLQLNIPIGVMNALYAPNEEFGLDDDGMLTLCNDLSQALKDCANYKPSSLHYPSERIIVNYLKKHSETESLDKKIIYLVASQFARQDKLNLNVPIGIMNALYAPDVELGLDDDTMLVICQSLTKVLKECAEGKKLPLDRYTSK